MRAPEIAELAGRLVGGDREKTHGDKLENFTKIANMLNAYLAIRRDPTAPLNAEDVGHIMGCIKMARTQSGSFNMDDYVDLTGYAACTGDVAFRLNQAKTEQN